MRVAIGYLVAALVVTSRTVRSAAQSSDDRAAPVTAAAAVTVAAAAAAEKVDDGANKTSVAVEKIAAYSAPAPTFVSHSGDVSGHNELSKTLFASAVIFSGVALAAAFAWLVAPLFGYKFCAIVGNCDGGGGGSSNVGNGEDSVTVNGSEEASALFPFSLGYRYNNAPYGGYRKRSLNYVGPILKTLSSAYEKFEQFSSTTPKVA